MPHIIVEYSNNIEPACSATELLRCIHLAAIGTGLFHEASVRTRAAPRSLYLVGNNQDATAGFIHITARIRPGRTEEKQASLSRALMDAIEQYLSTANYLDPLMVNVEIHELPLIRSGTRLPR